MTPEHLAEIRGEQGPEALDKTTSRATQSFGQSLLCSCRNYNLPSSLESEAERHISSQLLPGLPMARFWESCFRIAND